MIKLLLVSVLSVLLPARPQAGTIGDLFSKLMAFLAGLLSSIGSFLSDVFGDLFRMLYDVFRWLGDLLARLFQSLIDVLVSFFEVIYELIKGLLYLLYKIGVCVAKFFGLIWDLVLLLWSFIEGLGRTFAGVFFTPVSSGGHGYSGIMGKVAAGLEYFQLDTVAVILSFAIWLFGAFGVVRIVGSLRGGE